LPASRSPEQRCLPPRQVGGALEADAKRAYNDLVAKVPAANALGKRAMAVLVFPKIVKAGLVIGRQSGDGVLLKGGKPAGDYNTSGASYGLQAGAQEFGYAMFFMNETALRALSATDGFEAGVGLQGNKITRLGK
jgi:lipid-binding SYLF domain-containing protein